MAVDYTTLVADKSTAGSIKYWVNHDLVDAAGALILAQAWIYNRLRAAAMRDEVTVELDEGNYYEALPSGFLAPVSFKWRGDADPIRYVHENLLNRFRDEDGDPDAGRPQRYAIFGDKFQFEVKADDDLTADVICYTTPAALSGANTTNFLTEKYPALLRAACTAYGYEDRKRFDEAKTQFLMAEAKLNEANAVEDIGRQGQVLR